MKYAPGFIFWNAASSMRFSVSAVATASGTTAPVFSHAIAILPPWSVTSTNAIVNWSTENAGLTIVMGTRTTSNFES